MLDRDIKMIHFLNLSPLIILSVWLMLHSRKHKLFIKSYPYFLSASVNSQNIKNFRIHPAVDPDKVILDLSPEEAETLNGSELFHHVDFPIRNLTEMVQFNLITNLRDSSSDSILSSNSYEVRFSIYTKS